MKTVLARSEFSLKRRLLFIIVSASLFSLLIASIIFTVLQVSQIRMDNRHSLELQLNVIADNASAVVLFDDEVEAHRLLQSLHYDPQIRAAVLLTKDGEIVAEYHAQPVDTEGLKHDLKKLSSERISFQTYKGFDVLSRNIVYQDNEIGFVIFLTDQSRLFAVLSKMLFSVVVALSLGLLAAIVLAFDLRRWLIRPLEVLNNFVIRIVDENNYELRKKGVNCKEVNQLTHAFNSLLDDVCEAHERQQHAETELKQYSEQLESLVNIRTQALEAEKVKAEQSSRAKSLFLANVSHEIRTPMNAIVGFAQLLQKSIHQEKEARQLQYILDSSELLLSLIDDLLDVARIDENKLVVVCNEFDFYRLVDDVVKLIADKANAANLDFIVDIHAEVPVKIIGDALRIKQVILNLLSNAVKFTAQGFVALTVEVELSANGQKRNLIITVSDSGIGMADEARLRVFDSFEQADYSTTRQYGGFGLGLSICKKLTTLMGGEIQAFSKPGDGSRFVVRLPFSLAAPVEEPSAPCLKANCRGLLLASPSRMTTQLTDLLQSVGLSIVVVPEDSVFAINALKKGDFQHLIIGMCHLLFDYAALIRLVEADPNFAQLNITVLGSLSDKDYQGRAHVRFLEKPLYDRRKLRQHFFADSVNVSGYQAPKTDVTPFYIDSPVNILLVEDVEINRILIKEIFVNCRNINIVEAENGVEAVQLVRDQIFDLVLMDVQMPVMDGFEACRQIRQQFSPDQLPIIGMTAFASETDKTRCLQSGMDSVVIKPVNEKCLVDVLNNCMELSKVNQGCRGLQGIDVESGLVSLNGNVECFKQALQLFVKKYSSQQHVLRGFLEEGEWQQAQIWLHEIIGVSASLFMTAFVETLKTIQSGLEIRQVDQHLVSQFEQQLVDLIDQIQRQSLT